MQRFIAALLAGALCSGTGCFRHYTIPAEELRKLDGFDVPPPSPGRSVAPPVRFLRATDGALLTFDANTELFLRTANGRTGGKFQHVRVTPDAFEGVLAGLPPLHLDFTAIELAEATAMDQGTTAFIVLGTLAALLGSFLLAVWSVVNSG